MSNGVRAGQGRWQNRPDRYNRLCSPAIIALLPPQLAACKSTRSISFRSRFALSFCDLFRKTFNYNYIKLFIYINKYIYYQSIQESM